MWPGRKAFQLIIKTSSGTFPKLCGTFIADEISQYYMIGRSFCWHLKLINLQANLMISFDETTEASNEFPG